MSILNIAMQGEETRRGIKAACPKTTLKPSITTDGRKLIVNLSHLSIHTYSQYSEKEKTALWDYRTFQLWVKGEVGFGGRWKRYGNALNTTRVSFFFLILPFIFHSRKNYEICSLSFKSLPSYPWDPAQAPSCLPCILTPPLLCCSDSYRGEHSGCLDDSHQPSPLLLQWVHTDLWKR